ncbi:MAG: F0F1 ATP synthase subunit delta [Elusimicrobiota bacterium]|jgi:F0F1-type ATP synthase delta subunit|nr:F0F1 ATP synthase subunit delta [Elusimicrobiota bacterium]
MKLEQIKKLARSLVRDNAISDADAQWVSMHLSVKDKKLFIHLLDLEVKNHTAKVFYAGDLSDENKEVIKKLFIDKRVFFERDDEKIIGGICIEYGDFILDCSIAGLIRRTMVLLKNAADR